MLFICIIIWSMIIKGDASSGIQPLQLLSLLELSILFGVGCRLCHRLWRGMIKPFSWNHRKGRILWIGGSHWKPWYSTYFWGCWSRQTHFLHDIFRSHYLQLLQKANDCSTCEWLHHWEQKFLRKCLLWQSQYSYCLHWKSKQRGAWVFFWFHWQVRWDWCRSVWEGWDQKFILAWWGNPCLVFKRWLVRNEVCQE